MKIISIIIIIFYFFSAQAVEFEVGKVSKSGKKAVIYVPEGQTLEKGQILKFGGEEGSSSSKTVMTQQGQTTRNYSAGAGFSFTSDEIEVVDANDKVTGTLEQNKLGIDLTLLKNFGSFEIGGGLNYGKGSTKTENTSTLGAFAFGEFNIMKNLPGVSLVPHVGARLGYGSTSDEDNLGVETDASGIFYEVYGGVKYFILPASGLAVMASLFYKSDATNSTDLETSTVTSLGVKGGIRYYF